MKKFFPIFLLIIFLSGCSYSSIYKQNENINFEILSLEIKGDKDINYLIERELRQYVGTDNIRKFQVRINTKYSKNPISKDKTGKITKYKLIADLELEFEIDNQIQNVSLNETFNMENFDDKFEEKKYEKQIKSNFSSLMLNKIIPYLINFE
tara:strand:- start:1189 stop:1644 length:456 start_codon:yes stop_codon:yes gene_type:complete